ncbi:hypothetical protein NFI96_020534 [Prochilodus magdalenae]|nr:hypothetical protein NFI96_020534 [Prochilodus magdalenae]
MAPQVAALCTEKFTAPTTTGRKRKRCTKVDPAEPATANSSHLSLTVNSDSPPSPKRVLLTVFHGSTGAKVPLILNHTDTVQRLKEMVKQEKPNLGDRLHLIYNGKPVEAQQTMAELDVKPGSLFITYQKCVGG